VGDVVLELRREPRESRRLLADHLRGHHQVADQPALVGVSEAVPGGGRDLLHLPDVVQERSGDQQIAIHHRVVIGDTVRQLHHREDVLGEPSPIRVVNPFGRGGVG
jgi:hypothetical protein